ncbi:hypothetical protein TNCV_3941501 [Trichonephila clavipes]|uniref:Uncharacterized protein n=1 Tax=Trichonephila clavipes TaxID=2585209 RepID=A0A8X6VVY8_TRICX|nr:hypothetical protein TNCV_3941501 [Trichonephila clavipes]
MELQKIDASQPLETTGHRLHQDSTPRSRRKPVRQHMTTQLPMNFGLFLRWRVFCGTKARTLQPRVSDPNHYATPCNGEKNLLWAVGNLVARASDSRLEGLGSMPDATKNPPRTHGVRAR